MFYTGVCYETGVGVAKNVVEAARLYKLAADQGNVEAYFNLGIFFNLFIGNLIFR